MKIEIKQVSSLDKIRSYADAKTVLTRKTLLKGEKFNFQQVFYCSKQAEISVSVNSELKDFIKLYEVKETNMDFPCYPKIDGENYPEDDDDYITKTPGLMPDLLVPIEEQNGFIKFMSDFAVIWVEVNVPADFPAGTYDIDISFMGRTLSIPNDCISVTKTITVEILNAQIPEQEIIVTQWFHTDCIADVHNVPVYGEEHWDLIGKYMEEATEQGINMILTPVITPPLDTKPGSLRPNIQLVKIAKTDNLYSFDFSLLKRFIDLAKSKGLKYFEITHMFSQWGLEYSPNIYITENGEEKRLFGWHVSAKDESYASFLKQFLPALVDFFKREGIVENCYFHISDEPSLDHIEAYRYAYDLVKPLLGEVKIIEALSNIDFYETGLVSIPVTATDHIKPFLEKGIENQWAYYCCAEGKEVANRFLSMPSYRNRILGLTTACGSTKIQKH